MFNILSQKRCSKCGEWKNKNEFSVRKDRKGGCASWCKECSNANAKERNKNNPRSYATEKERERSRRRRKENPERAKFFVDRWNKEHPEKSRERSLKWSRANPEKHRQIFHNWSTPEKEAERRKKRLEANPERERAVSNARNQKRRACILGVGGTITKEEWRWLKEFYNFTCLCCGKQEPEIKLTLDHVLPVSLGGKNIIENAQPLCQPCNSSKHNKYIDYRKTRSLF